MNHSVRDMQISFHFLLYRPKWIEIYGQIYNLSCYINTGWQEDDSPMFGKISDIIVICAHTPLLFVHLFQTNGINGHILAHDITPTGNTALIILSELRNKDIYHSHPFVGDDKFYIITRSHITSENE